jgi:hypothetical protein
MHGEYSYFARGATFVDPYRPGGIAPHSSV